MLRLPVVQHVAVLEDSTASRHFSSYKDASVSNDSAECRDSLGFSEVSCDLEILTRSMALKILDGVSTDLVDSYS